jgi:hypothetical protein
MAAAVLGESQAWCRIQPGDLSSSHYELDPRAVAVAGAQVAKVVLERPHASRAVCQAGRVDIVFPLQTLHRSRWPAFGTAVVSGSASTLTSAERLQASHVAITARTPFWRMFAKLMRGPGLLLMVAPAGRFLARNRRT